MITIEELMLENLNVDELYEVLKNNDLDIEAQNVIIKRIEELDHESLN